MGRSMQQPSVVTIGTFDGVHLGHQHLIELVRNRGAAIDARAGVITFEPVPLAVLRPDVYRGRICNPSEKLSLLEKSGADFVEVIAFSIELSRLSPEEFMTTIVSRLSIVELMVGDDFALGRNRAGNVEVLTEIGTRLGYRVEPIERLAPDGLMASSTEIRRAIESGNVALAATLLGRPFRLSGDVIHGAHLGRRIGFPTANFIPPVGIVPLADGIYAAYAHLPDRPQPLEAMTYVGTRPTIDGGDRHIETNILDFDEDLYGQTLRIDLVERVRADKTFDGLDPLIAQLHQDELVIRSILASPQVRTRKFFDRAVRS
ncbi:bifunctional riboflavin kinase/FAD synthetase [soil metagenome]